MVSYMTQLNEDNINEFTSNGLSIVYITAPWCNPCKTLGPIVEELSSSYANTVSFGKINADENKDLVMSTGIRNIPTILLYKDGEIIDKSVGLITKEKLSDFINQYL